MSITQLLFCFFCVLPLPLAHPQLPRAAPGMRQSLVVVVLVGSRLDLKRTAEETLVLGGGREEGGIYLSSLALTPQR